MVRSFLIVLLLFCLSQSVNGAPVLLPPYPVAQGANLLTNSDFSAVQQGVKNRKMPQAVLPQQWRLQISGGLKDVSGNIYPVPLTGGNGLRCELEKNIYNAVKLVTGMKIPTAKLRSPHYAGFWAKGAGTVHCELVTVNGKNIPLESIHTVDKWHFYRVGKLPEISDAETFELAFAIYGDVTLAYPEISPLPEVDPAAQLVFYAPFDNGRLEARYSVGNVFAMGLADAKKVPGIAGTAIRLDRKRYLGNNGALRYPFGFGYDFMDNVISKDAGTVEFFFRPLPEMLEKQEWGGFPLFYLGDTTWQWQDAQDFSLKMEYVNGKLQLILKECMRDFTYPDAGLLKPVRKNTAVYTIAEPEKFIGRFHHLAFTYDAKYRTVYLDGQPVIRIKALKTPAISSKVAKLLFAESNINHPARMSADLDELKIYRGVRYNRPFAPDASVPELRPVPAETKHGKKYSRQLRAGKAALSADRSALLIPLESDGEKYTLSLEIGDGYPLIFAARNGVTRMRAEHLPPLPPLPLELVEHGSGKTVLQLDNGVTAVLESRTDASGMLKLALKLQKSSGDWSAYLEPRFTLRRHGAPWQTGFDGLGEHPVLLPFTPFEFPGLMAALPLAMAYGKNSGMAFALAPESLCGFISRGMDAPDTLMLKLRTVLDEGVKAEFKFQCFAFDPRYGIDDGIDRYHRQNLEFFALDKRINPALYGNNGLEKVWDNPAYRQRAAEFSHREAMRLTRSSWCWFYHDGSSCGNWAVDNEVLKRYPPINLTYRGDMNFNHRTVASVAKNSEHLKSIGIAPSYYISSWAEKRLARHFPDSIIEPQESYNGVVSWPDYWKRGVTDQIMMPSGSSYGRYLRRQAKKLMEQYPGAALFSYDLCGYSYLSRKANTLGGLNAFDENGRYLPHVTALGVFLNDLRQMPNDSPYRCAAVGNSDFLLSSFNASFRTDNTLHEQQLVVTLQSWGVRKAQTRLNGEKPTVFMPMPKLDGNFAKKDDAPQISRYSSIYFHHAHILTGLLFNIRQCFQIAGVRESVQALDELLRIQSLGHRQSTGALTADPVELVRYGEPGRGTIAVINFHPFPRRAQITVESDYFGVTALLASAHGKVKVNRDGTLETGLIPALSFAALDMPGTVPGVRELAYESVMERKIDSWTASFKFTAPADLRGAKFIPQPGETVTFAVNGKAVDVIPEQLGTGDTLTVKMTKNVWLTPAAEIAALPLFEQNKLLVSAEPALETAAANLQEFFRFRLRKMRPALQTVSVSPAAAKIILRSGGPGIALDGGKIVISGSKTEISKLVDEFLKLMETKYPYYGVFGTQQPTYPLDWAVTGMQRRFNVSAGLIGKCQSVAKIAAEFMEYVKENKKNVQQGL